MANRYTKNEYQYKNKTIFAYWTKDYKNCIVQEYCNKTQRYRITIGYENLSKSKCNEKMKTKEVQKIYKICSKTVELPFANMKQNFHIMEFTNWINTGEHRIQTICMGS